MKLHLVDGLPFVSAKLSYRGQSTLLEHVLLDTGSASTLFAIDHVQSISLHLEPNDAVHRIRGVGGTEFVFSKQLDGLTIGNLHVDEFVVEIGAMDYGLPLQGILGMDFLPQTRAKINFNQLTIR